MRNQRMEIIECEEYTVLYLYCMSEKEADSAKLSLQKGSYFGI
jgi:hypothetical protein